MNRNILIASFSLLAASLPAQFYSGNLAVVRLGAAGQTLANTGNSVFLEQYTTLGSFVNQVAIPDSGANALIMSGSATSEGALSLSPNGQLLAIGGYNTPRPYASSVSGSTSANVPRVVGTVALDGSFALASSTTTYLSANNIRGGFTDGQGNYWGVGAATANGISYFGSGTPAIVAGVNARVLNAVNGSFYYSTGSGTRGIYSLAGAFPTSAATPTAAILTGSSSSPYDFSFSPSGLIAYIADDTASAAGGVQRWENNGGTWTLAYTLGTGVNNIGARGLSVDWSGANPVIYGTSAESTANRIFTITDTGAGSLAATLATAGAGTSFRGLEMVPEPSSFAVLGLGLAALLGLRRKS